MTASTVFKVEVAKFMPRRLGLNSCDAMQHCQGSLNTHNLGQRSDLRMSDEADEVMEEYNSGFGMLCNVMEYTSCAQRRVCFSPGWSHDNDPNMDTVLQC